jgi:ferric-dicitrate binding protein FerR (iron transport regulator)
MRKKQLYQQLVHRYISGEASTDEVEVFFHLLNKGKLDGYLREATGRDAATGGDLAAHEAIGATTDGDATGGRPALVRSIGTWKWYGVAAAILLLIGAGILLWPRHTTAPASAVVTNIIKNDVAPGGNKAVLILADGARITLDSARDGALASQGRTKVVKVDAGRLSYRQGSGADGGGKNAAAANGLAAVTYNMLMTPPGGQYEVTLSDGTKVWLNAMSVLRYPTVFSGLTRTVELSGEAYFEVAKDKDHSFVVTTAQSQVRVLGTSFNINSYGDEPGMITTLLDGAVELSGKGLGPNKGVVLKPGQQALEDLAGLHGGMSNFKITPDADVEQAIAWKNGSFSFDGADVHTVMRQIARWYGVKIQYEGTPTTALFGGEIGRDLSLAQVLEGLSKTKVHFRLENKTLTVLP